jgi:2-polyprenyl-3-methyl-5-hydroxy-6-metoxy-1,4-benzoquinol methylase
VDLLKLDVEGAEYEVIDSIIESGVRIGTLCIEFHTPSRRNSDERVENSIKKLLKAHFIPVFADVRNYTFVNADEYLQDRTPLCAKTSSENLGLTGRRLNAAKQERKNCDTFKIKLFDSEPGEVIAAKQVIKSYYLLRLKDVWQNHNSPVWFDHEIDYHMWPKNLFWIERGVFGRITMTPGCRVLDLCCGDGYFSDVWYSTIAACIDACDNDSDALNFAAQKHSNERIRYHRVDVLADALPGTNYDVVTWFAAIEHFTEDQIVYILQKINSSLNRNGRLIGSTILVEQIGGLRNSQHKREFTSQNDLANVLRRVFTNSHTWVSAYPERLECFFQCGK